VLILAKIPNIKPKNFYPNPKLQIIFESKAGERHDNASLYQNILKYAHETHEKSNLGFKFLQLGNWLMRYNKEFLKYYSGDKAHTPINARIANKRQRIQNCIDNLIKWNFLFISDWVQADKNNTQTPLYAMTAEGEIIFMIIKAKFSNDEEKNIAIKRIIDILTSIRGQNDSVVLLFITNFLNELLQNKKTYYIIKHFTDRILKFELNNGHDFLSHLLGLKYLIIWFVTDKNTSFKILDSLNNSQKKIFLFHLKNEIEYFYQENYLEQDVEFLKKIPNIDLIAHKKGNNLIYSGGIPSAYWESKRIEYIESYSKVVVPGYCNKCGSHRAFIIPIEEYLKSIIASYSPYPSFHVSGVCLECNSSLFSFVLRLPWGSAAWE